MSPTKLSDAVLKKLKKEEILQKPKWHFWLEGFALGLATLVFLVIGILAAAVVELFITDLHLLKIFELDFAGGLKSFFIGLPLFWIVVLVGLVFLTSYLLKKSETGYRHPLWFWLLGIVVIQVIGGVLLAESRFGSNLERVMEHEIFRSQNLTEHRNAFWNRSRDGVLAGRIMEIEDCETPDLCIIKVQSRGARMWVVDVSDAEFYGNEAFNNNQRLRFIGAKTSESEFTASRVLPWQRDRARQGRDRKARGPDRFRPNRGPR